MAGRRPMAAAAPCRPSLAVARRRQVLRFSAHAGDPAGADEQRGDGFPLLVVEQVPGEDDVIPVDADGERAPGGILHGPYGDQDGQVTLAGGGYDAIRSHSASPVISVMCPTVSQTTRAVRTRSRSSWSSCAPWSFPASRYP